MENENDLNTVFTKNIQQKYIARFGIDGGISQGFGIKYPDYITIDKIIDAKDDLEAVCKAAKEAYKLSRSHLSNPDTDYTTVTMLQLYNDTHVLLDQKKILEKQGYKSISVNKRDFEWKENTLSISCSMLEHLLTL